MPRMDRSGVIVTAPGDGIELRAYQASRRGGELICRVNGDRIALEGTCVFYLQGEVEI